MARRQNIGHIRQQMSQSLEDALGDAAGLDTAGNVRNGTPRLECSQPHGRGERKEGKEETRKRPLLSMLAIALLSACLVATALASQPAIAVFIEHSPATALSESEQRSLKLFFVAAARSVCPATAFFVSTMPQLASALKECRGTGLVCHEIPHLPASPADGSNVLSVFVGDGPFDRERRVFSSPHCKGVEASMDLRARRGSDNLGKSMGSIALFISAAR